MQLFHTALPSISKCIHFLSIGELAFIFKKNAAISISNES